jgi:DNA polymerase III alpha subunit (gram-positive type)
MQLRYASALLFLFGFSMLPSHAETVPAKLATTQSFALALIDVETTGLDADVHEMIDIGAVYVDVDGRELGRFFIRIKPAHPERAQAGAKAVNGYSEKRWRALGAVSSSEAIRAFEEFHHQTAADRTMIFTAFNVGFDQAFVSRWLSREGRSFRDWYFYQVLDLPSMAWAQGLRELSGSEIAQALGIPAETRDPLRHTGETGADFNLSVYRELMKRSSGSLR